MEKAIKENKRNEISKLRAKLKQELKSSMIERERVAAIKAGLYSDYKQGIISLDDYKDMRQKFEIKQNVLDKKIEKLNKNLYQLDNGNSYSTDAANAFTKYSGISEITRELLGDLVEKIVIYADKNIKIIFKFQDELKRYLN